VVNGQRFVLDTNIILYHLGGRLREPLPAGEYFISAISELELLSYPEMTRQELEGIQRFLACVSVVELDTAVKAAAISRRRDRRLKLPDAIVVATADVLGAVLLTNDARLGLVEGLEVRSLAFD
jgi:predicted nucleic acid-binding protein